MPTEGVGRKGQLRLSSISPLLATAIAATSAVASAAASVVTDGVTAAATGAAAGPATSSAQSFLKSRLPAVLSSSMQKFAHAFSGWRRDSMIVLAATGIITPWVVRLGLSPILGFLWIGMVLGPNGLSSIKGISITEQLAELGIVFFLFEMGLELSVERLMQMKRDVFGLGALQFTTSAALIFCAARLLGQTAAASAVIGGALALSSSAFVLQLLRDKEELGTRHGRASFGVLLFQDLAVVPLLVITPLLAAGGGSAMGFAMGVAGIKAALAFCMILLFGKYGLNKLFDFVAKSRSQEAFLSNILMVALGMSMFTEGLGLSSTLGAFMAGVLLSETKYRYQVGASCGLTEHTDMHQQQQQPPGVSRACRGSDNSGPW